MGVQLNSLDGGGVGGGDSPVKFLFFYFVLAFHIWYLLENSTEQSKNGWLGL